MTALGRGAGWAIALSLGLLSGACSSAASPSGRSSGSGSPGSHTPRRDRFDGSIVLASGAYAGDTGHARINLHPHGAGHVRPVGVVFRGKSCSGARHCLALNGTVAGTLAEQGHQIPDTGTSYALTGTGQITHLGMVTARGTVQATGFIMRGQETLRVTLRSSSGSVTLQALSPTVKGFASP